MIPTKLITLRVSRVRSGGIPRVFGLTRVSRLSPDWAALSRLRARDISATTRETATFSFAGKLRKSLRLRQRWPGQARPETANSAAVSVAVCLTPKMSLLRHRKHLPPIAHYRRAGSQGLPVVENRSGTACTLVLGHLEAVDVDQARLDRPHRPAPRRDPESLPV